MFPILFQLGPLSVRTYGACMALGFILCWSLIERLSGRKDFSNLLFALMFAGIVGSRAAYVIEHWQTEFAGHWEQILRVDQGGLMFYGGLILSTIAFFVWCAVKRENPLAVGDLCCAVIPLGHALGRVGCFFYGCCYGKITSSSWAVSFPRLSPAWCEQWSEKGFTALSPVQQAWLRAHPSLSLPVLPTQLFEAAGLLLLFVVLVFFFRRWAASSVNVRSPKRSIPGLVCGIYLLGYGVLRFGMETLRGDPRAEVGVFSISQTISFGVVAAGVLFVIGSFWGSARQARKVRTTASSDTALE